MKKQNTGSPSANPDGKGTPENVLETLKKGTQALVMPCDNVLIKFLIFFL